MVLSWNGLNLEERLQILKNTHSCGLERLISCVDCDVICVAINAFDLGLVLLLIQLGDCKGIRSISSINIVERSLEGLTAWK